jgi:hypothetical protein
MCCIINTNMSTNTRLLNEQYSLWLEKRFQGKNVANIRFHLNHYHVEPCLRGEFYQAVADRFRHNYSRAFVKGIRRSGALLDVIIHLHKQQASHRNDAPHLHILAVYPDEKTIDDVSSFVFKFCNKARLDPITDTMVLDTMRTFDVSDATTITGSFIYNGREGHSSMLHLL